MSNIPTLSIKVRALGFVWWGWRVRKHNLGRQVFLLPTLSPQNPVLVPSRERWRKVLKRARDGSR